MITKEDKEIYRAFYYAAPESVLQFSDTESYADFMIALAQMFNVDTTGGYGNRGLAYEVLATLVGIDSESTLPQRLSERLQIDLPTAILIAKEVDKGIFSHLRVELAELERRRQAGIVPEPRPTPTRQPQQASPVQNSIATNTPPLTDNEINPVAEHATAPLPATGPAPQPNPPLPTPPPPPQRQAVRSPVPKPQTSSPIEQKLASLQ